MTKIVLLEFVDEFGAFKEYLRQSNHRIEDFLIVALDPKVGARLKAENISYRNTLPYFNNDSQRRILVKAEEAMEHIRQNFLFSDENGVKRCYQVECLHYLRLFLNHIFKILEIIASIAKQHGDVQWYALVGDVISAQPLIGAQERYCGILLKRFAEHNRMYFVQINRNFEEEAGLKKAIRRFPILEKKFFSIVIWFLRGKKIILVPRVDGPFRGLIKDIFARNKDIVFLAIDSQEGLAKVAAYNLVLLFKSCCLKKQAPSCVINAAFFHPRIPRAQQDALSRLVNRFMDEEYEPIFSYSGVECLDLVRRKVERSVRPHLERILIFSYALEYALKRLDTCLVMSYIGLGIMGVAGELAGVMKKKSLFISHGTHPVPIDEYHELELYNHCCSFMLGDYTHVALCTPVQEAHLRYFKGKYQDIINQEIRTGPLIFTNISQENKERYKRELGIPRDCRVFTQAVSIKPRYGERFYFLETMDEFFAALTDMVKAINTINNVRLVIRLHPGFSWSNEEIKSLLPASDRYIINQTGPFSRVLETTDVLISYSSTTIDEALINRIPVLLYDKWNRYNHFKTGIFEQDDSEDIYPVCYVNNCNKLRPAMEFMIRKTKSVNPREMDIKQYCYDQDYRESFNSFIRQSLSHKN